ncbi:MAG TPA: hypothetical protein VFI98_09445 [Pseudolabrys sp.]|nr:hypothetical protein [Pseudolabrys sp.]
MLSSTLKVLAACLSAAFVIATPADAANSRKHKKVAPTTKLVRNDPLHRGTDLVPAGPLYFGDVYLGDDPDPNIRFQLLRDISGRMGGDP